MANTNKTKTGGRVYLRRKELATRWGVSIATLKRMEKKGELRTCAISERSIRYHIQEIERIEAELKGGK
jgi:predicted site-specific integrase-resolvase